jgi:CDP-diacylglycerol--serine O-phosphatidyltransferase
MARQWRYVLPNLVTCISIGVGLLAISRATAGDYDDACWWCLLCVLLDKADGTVARLLKASSDFGVQLDSLSDLITFGVAPSAIVLAAFVGKHPVVDLSVIPSYRALVYVGAFLFAICSALRLAKFNVLTDRYGKAYFFGLPTTLTGALVCAYYLTARKYGLPWQVLAALPSLMIILALLMVSRVPLPKLVVRSRLSLNLFQFANVFFVYFFGLLRMFPEYLLAVGFCYATIGMLVGVLQGAKPPAPTGEFSQG